MGVGVCVLCGYKQAGVFIDLNNAIFMLYSSLCTLYYHSVTYICINM